MDQQLNLFLNKKQKKKIRNHAGLIMRKAHGLKCYVTGNTNNLHLHHTDYLHPDLHVILCAHVHRALHSELKRIGGIVSSETQMEILNFWRLYGFYDPFVTQYKAPGEAFRGQEVLNP